MKDSPGCRGGHGRLRGIVLFVSMLLPLMLAGCVRAPSFNILGSYFPSWIFCIALGIALTLGVHVIFRRINFEQQLVPLVLVYPSLACFFAFTLWLLLFN